MPLERCPGLKVWQLYRDCEYRVFIDESFDKFFGFSDANGDFCHGALGVPVENYGQLQTLIAPEVAAYKRVIAEASGAPPLEMKSTILRRLPLKNRLEFTRKLACALTAVGGFVAGFYTTTRGIVMERVRTGLLGRTDRVPDDHADLYELARGKLLAEFKGVAQSKLIKQLLLLPLSAITNLLGSFNCNFRIRYDPRCRVEDEEVRRSMLQFMEQLTNVPELFGSASRLLGMDIDVASHEDLGLQLVDVFVGEVRNFFRTNRETLSEHASLNLIDSDSDEPLQYFLEFNNSRFKIGALSPMSSSLVRKLSRENSENLVSYYYPILASGILSCVTETGQPRLIEIPTRLFLDQSE